MSPLHALHQRAQRDPRSFKFGYLKPRSFDERTGPQPKQALAHVCLADILFYGGAAGGGKSEFDIVEAVTTCLEFPGCEVAIFRRTHKDLLRSIVGRFRALVPKYVAKFNKSDMCATVWNGSILWFCHCQHESDVYDYQSAAWVELIIDEASHFTQFQADYLMTRVRSAEGRRKRIILTSNPGNVGHGWLKRLFLKPSPDELGNRPLPLPGEVWRPLPREDDPTPPEEILTRCFIPARFEDNPALALNDPTYLSKLWRLGGDKARQLALGDWDANEGMIVGKEWQERHVVTKTDLALIAGGLVVGQEIPWHVINIPKWLPPEGSLIYGSVDYGYGAPWSFHLHAVLAGGHVRTFFELYSAQVRDVDQARRIKAAILMLQGQPELGGCNMSTPEWIVYDPQMKASRAEMGLAKSIIEVYDDEMAAPLRIHLMSGSGGRAARLSRPNRWKDALSIGADGWPLWSVTTACPNLIRTVPEIPWDEDDKDVEDDASENHCYEDTGRFFEARPIAPPAKKIDPWAHLDPISRAHHEARAAKDHPKHGKVGRTGFTGAR